MAYSAMTVLPDAGRCGHEHRTTLVESVEGPDLERIEREGPSRFEVRAGSGHGAGALGRVVEGVELSVGVAVSLPAGAEESGVLVAGGVVPVVAEVGVVSAFTGSVVTVVTGVVESLPRWSRPRYRTAPMLRTTTTNPAAIAFINSLRSRGGL